MKKILYTILFAMLLLPNLTKAQEAAGPVGTIWSFPVIYNYDEEVTWYFDLSGPLSPPNLTFTSGFGRRLSRMQAIGKTLLNSPNCIMKETWCGVSN
ncbi:hypothetical protein [Flavobacterium sp. 3HN19-14]|uniref:hypothetical protein n=1 Tax=Flavobacterium sp. 3HN19-14 TaxID=3448133 RepID=UPI003EE0E845